LTEYGKSSTEYGKSSPGAQASGGVPADAAGDTVLLLLGAVGEHVEG
jgi:hypothetical protein